MQNQNSDNLLLLKVITPDLPPFETECDSVHLTVSDGPDSSGLYGIRKGHADTVFLLAKGKCEARLDGKVIKSFICGGGFAKTENGNTVTVTAENAIEM